jgi:hypothetical protein
MTFSEKVYRALSVRSESANLDQSWSPIAAKLRWIMGFIVPPVGFCAGTVNRLRTLTPDLASKIDPSDFIVGPPGSGSSTAANVRQQWLSVTNPC